MLYTCAQCELTHDSSVIWMNHQVSFESKFSLLPKKDYPVLVIGNQFSHWRLFKTIVTVKKILPDCYSIDACLAPQITQK